MTFPESPDPAVLAGSLHDVSTILNDLLGVTVVLARAHPTKGLHESLAALGEALARVRFAAAVIEDHAS